MRIQNDKEITQEMVDYWVERIYRQDLIDNDNFIKEEIKDNWR